MDKALDLDWSLLRAVLAVAEHGSLSAAARVLGQSQPTLGRQIHAAETALGCALFIRQPRGLEQTQACRSILAHLRNMRDAAAHLQLAAAGYGETLAGSVRITASTMISLHQLPRALVKMRIAEPQITYDIVPSDAVENLLFRRADIAIRMFRPDHPDVIIRKLGDIALGLFAHRTYLARRGLPRDGMDLINHDMIGYDQDDRITQIMQGQGLNVSRDDFVARCDSDVHYSALVAAGVGIGGLQLDIGRRNPDLVQILPEVALPTLPVQLVAQADLLRNPRMRRVWDLLAAHLLA